jgi:ankyrin repeat protein
MTFWCSLLSILVNAVCPFWYALFAFIKESVARQDGGTALIVSSQCGHTDVVELLLARGADPNTAMRDRATALFVAAQNGHTAVVRWPVAPFLV